MLWNKSYLLLSFRIPFIVSISLWAVFTFFFLFVTFIRSASFDTLPILLATMIFIALSFWIFIMLLILISFLIQILRNLLFWIFSISIWTSTPAATASFWRTLPFRLLFMVITLSSNGRGHFGRIFTWLIILEVGTWFSISFYWF